VNTERRIPPVWILSLPTLAFGMVMGFVIVTLPQMLAAQGVSGGRIAIAVAIITSPAFWSFLLAPVLDLRFRRRTYAIAFGLLASAATAVAVRHHSSAAEVEAVMFVGVLCAMLFTSATGGWTGSLIEKAQDSRLGAWVTVFNIGGGGAGILISGYVTQHFSPAAAAAFLFALLLAPMLVFPLIPAPPPDRTLARESFGRFIREITSLFRRTEVLVPLALFTLPSASFALTNVLGGWGKDFHAAPALVSVVGGVGNIAAGIIGCSLVPLIARKLPLRPLYLSIGLIGAVFTLSLLLMPHASWTYALAFMGENVFQSAAIATALAIAFEVIGPGNPLAATILSLLTAASNLPIVYMEVVDAHGYDWHGVNGAFLTDALVSGAACLLLAFLLHRRLFAGAVANEPA
jgi:PAT family beta-lactamase induction signal transducer AmpG